MDAPQSPIQKNACGKCARRKIRCDRRQPCSNCVAHARMTARRNRNKKDVSGHDVEIECIYVEPPPGRRLRRHKHARTVPSNLANDLMDRLQMYEDLLQKNGITAPQSFSQEELPSFHEPLPRPGSCESCNDIVSDHRIWIASPWEAKMAAGNDPTTSSIAQTPSSGVDTIVDLANTREGMKTWPTVVHEDAADEELELWRSLPPELRNPPVSEIFARRFFGQKTINERSLSEKIPQPLEMNTTSILFGTSNLAPVPHPEPRMILHLWQTFIDSVNPVMRIVHVPTTHKQIVDASWDPANAPPATGALMFAVYALALTSMTISEYADMFTTTKTRQTSDDAVPPKRELLTKYRMGAMQCLVAAGILTTRRLDVLRAFTLFILAEPDSELCSTLASTAVHLGLKLGLHRETSKSTPEGTGTLSFFDREMSVRLWWQILGIDARMRLAVSLSYTNSISTMGSNKHSRFATGGNYFGSSMPLTDLVDLRLPLNVNDADLHPDMTCAPVEHAGPTEMLYVRVKYHTAPWMQTFAQKKFVSSTSGDLGEVSTPAGHLFHTQTLPAMKNCAIDELEQLYTNICHQFADPRIPLHAVSSSMARMAVAQLRFQAYHPRTSAAQPPSQPPSALANGEQVSVIPAFSRYNADATFKHALSILEMCFGCRQVAGVGNGFAAFQLLADLVMRVVMDAIVYVLCMLRVRTCGENDDDEERAKIDSAWRMIELFYKEYAEDLAAATSAYEPHLLHMHHNASHTREPRNNDATTEENRKLAAGATFVAAFTDLTLEAFDAHEKAWLGLGKGALITPEFIAELRAQKNTQREFLDPSSAAGTGLGEMLLQADDFAMDWEYLNNLLQI